MSKRQSERSNKSKVYESLSFGYDWIGSFFVFSTCLSQEHTYEGKNYFIFLKMLGIFVFLCKNRFFCHSVQTKITSVARRMKLLYCIQFQCKCHFLYPMAMTILSVSIDLKRCNYKFSSVLFSYCRKDFFCLRCDKTEMSYFDFCVFVLHTTPNRKWSFFHISSSVLTKKKRNFRLFSFPSEIFDYFYINFSSSFSTVVDFEQISVVDV